MCEEQLHECYPDEGWNVMEICDLPRISYSLFEKKPVSCGVTISFVSCNIASFLIACGLIIQAVKY